MPCKTKALPKGQNLPFECFSTWNNKNNDYSLPPLAATGALKNYLHFLLGLFRLCLYIHVKSLETADSVVALTTHLFFNKT